MKATVIRAFLRNEVEMLPGQTFECTDHEYYKWAALGFVQGYEMKVEPPPLPEKKRPSELLHQAPAPRKKTPKRSRKSVTKS